MYALDRSCFRQDRQFRNLVRGLRKWFQRIRPPCLESFRVKPLTFTDGTRVLAEIYGTRGHVYCLKCNSFQSCYHTLGTLLILCCISAHVQFSTKDLENDLHLHLLRSFCISCTCPLVTVGEFECRLGLTTRSAYETGTRTMPKVKTSDAKRPGVWWVYNSVMLVQIVFNKCALQVAPVGDVSVE